MSSRVLLTLAFVALASASEAFWTCERDTFRTCLSAKPSLPANHFCGPCLSESAECVICQYFTEDPRADDVDRMFLDWWGAWLIVIPAALMVVGVPLLFFLCVFGRWFCCNTFGGRYPNYGLCSPSDSAPQDAHPTDRLSPDGFLLRAYSEKEVRAPRKGFAMVGVVFFIAFVLFLIAAVWSGNAAASFMDKGVDTLTHLSIDAMRTVDSISTSISAHPTVFASLRGLVSTTRSWVTNLYAAKEELVAFRTENGDGAVFLINFTKWFAVGLAIVGLGCAVVGYVANVTKVRRFWPFVLAFVFFWMSAVGFAGAVVSVGPAWYLNDGCDAVRETIRPADGEISPMSGAISVLTQLSRTPKQFVDFGRGPAAAWSAACAAVDASNTCTFLEPHFSCALERNGCVAPSTPTRATYNTYVEKSGFVFNTAGGATASMTDCANGAASCSCAQFSVGGSRANAVAYDKCERYVRAISVELHVIQAALQGMTDTLTVATAPFTGALNVEVVQTKLEGVVDDCDAAATSFIFAACGFGAVALGGLLGVLFATMSMKRNVEAGHVPLLPEPEDDDGAGTVRTQAGDGRTKVVAVLQSHTNQPIVLGELNVPPHAMPLPPSVVQGSGVSNAGGSVYGGTSARSQHGGMWSPFGAPTTSGSPGARGAQYPPVAYPTAPSSRAVSSHVPPRRVDPNRSEGADGPAPATIGEAAAGEAAANGERREGGSEFPAVGAVLADMDGEPGDPMHASNDGGGPQWAGAVAE